MYRLILLVLLIRPIVDLFKSVIDERKSSSACAAERVSGIAISNLTEPKKKRGSDISRPIFSFNNGISQINYSIKLNFPLNIIDFGFL